MYFEDIYNLYKFDTELKTIVFEAATNIEINFKSLLSEVISSQYGIKEKIYLKKENFAPDTGKVSITLQNVQKRFNYKRNLQYVYY